MLTCPLILSVMSVQLTESVTFQNKLPFSDGPILLLRRIFLFVGWFAWVVFGSLFLFWFGFFLLGGWGEMGVEVVFVFYKVSIT